jgi:hypothetical protein
MGLLRYFVIATLLSLAGAATPALAGQATLGVGAANIKLDPDNFGPTALEGSDLFGVSYEYPRDNSSLFDAVIWRQSVVSGKRVKLRTLKTKHGAVRAIEAGGGRVAVQVFYSGEARLTTDILSFSRNGTKKTVLASASQRSVSRSDGEELVCERFPYLVSAAKSGAFVISRATPVWTNGECGAKRIRTDWRYVEISRQGNRRLLHDSTTKRAGEPDLNAPLAEVEVNGDYAAFVTRKSLRVFVKNLKTGAIVGPFIDSVRKLGQKISSIGVELTDDGVLLITADPKLTKGKPGERWTDLFMNPADPATAVRSSAVYNVQFCGSRLVALDYDDTSDQSYAVELDRQTLSIRRRLVRLGNFDWIATCTATNLTVSRSEPGPEVLRVLTLPG